MSMQSLYHILRLCDLQCIVNVVSVMLTYLMLCQINLRQATS